MQNQIHSVLWQCCGSAHTIICCGFSYSVYVVCAATIVLDSSAACPGKVVTYTCTVRQGAILDWIVEPFLPASARIQFLTTRPIGSSLDCSSVSTVNCTDLDFVATLTNLTNPTTVPGGTVADMTSTLAFTATLRLNGTVVQCRGTTADGVPMTNITLNVAGKATLQHFFSCLLTVLATAHVQHIITTKVRNQNICRKLMTVPGIPDNVYS